ncbi:hypothetical protein BaRGS_00001845 [Batillaria attramentaria]|uniref:Uncharacterized protein n=1 Tax=Batillaria attramentaria TaxID=370345 RepID=A0ABD0M6E7_9CAEN
MLDNYEYYRTSGTSARCMTSCDLVAVLERKLRLLFCSVCVQLKKKPRDKPLLRRKSELPHDLSMVKALESHKRADEYLVTSSETTN